MSFNCSGGCRRYQSSLSPSQSADRVHVLVDNGGSAVSTYRFADIELDIDRFEVTRGGRRLALEPKAIDVLRFLVERPARLVTKDELLDGVWKDVAVTPNALTRVVAQLRRGLGDDAGDARIIETVPTRGYRFIAEVTRHEAIPSTAEAAAPPPLLLQPLADQPLPPSTVSRYRWRAPAAAAIAALVVAAAWIAAAGRVDPGPAAGQLVELEAGTGSMLSASFSPDGRWLAIVSDRSGDFEIWVRDVERGTSRAVTADGMRNVHPTWSPDSSHLAYHSALRKGVWTIGRDGGAARQLATVGSRPAWSPDGRWIVFQSDEWVTEKAQPGSHLMLVPADGGGAARVLTRAGDPPGGHWQPAWSPDGTVVYFGAARNGPADYWSVRVSDGLLTKRAENWHYRVGQLTPGPSGVSAWTVEVPSPSRRVVRVEVGDASYPTRPQTDVVIASLPASARSVSIAPGGRTAALVLVESSEAIWTLPVTAAGAPAGAPQRLRHGAHPAFSPDGRRLAYDTGVEIRVMNIDGTGDRPVITGGRRVGYPTWSTDRRLFGMRWVGLSPYLVEADLETGAVTERLALPESTSFPRIAPDQDTVVATLGEPLNTVGRGSLAAGTFGAWPRFAGYGFPVWSPDGRRLALERKDGQHMAMYLADADTGVAARVSPDTGQFWPGAFSPDGRRVALSTPGDRGVWNIETLDPATGERTRVTREASPEVVTRYPTWSADGTLLAYDRSEFRGHLYLVTLPGEPATR